MFQFRPSKFFFNGRDGYGDDPTQSPLWVRPRSLKKDGFSPETFRQVVGHTAFKKLLVEDERFFFIDTLGTSGEYLTLEDGVVRIDQLFNE